MSVGAIQPLARVRALLGLPGASREAGIVPADVLAAARAEGLHLLLGHRLGLASCAGDLRDAAIVDALRARELRLVLDGLAAAGVRAILLKGAALALTHYPLPETRPRSDTDLMIAASDRDAVTRALLGLGYQRASEIDGDIAVGQFHFQRHDGYDLLHALDVHWRVSNVRAFADVLTYEELARDALPLPPLGSNAWSPSPVHALLVACVHRVAHHGDSADLLWLFDLHLLARGLSVGERRAFVQLASSRRMRAVCARGLTLASEAFGAVDDRDNGGDREWIASLSDANGAAEPSAGFLGRELRQVDILTADLAATPRWRERIQLLGEHLFPSSNYMRQKYAAWPGALLPVAYLHRIVRGAPRWLGRTVNGDRGEHGE
jgi:hypothetical protein